MASKSVRVFVGNVPWTICHSKCICLTTYSSCLKWRILIRVTSMTIDYFVSFARTEELREYFSKFGRVLSSQVSFVSSDPGWFQVLIFNLHLLSAILFCGRKLQDKKTGFNRGFGFVVVDQECYENIRNTKTHFLEGSTVSVHICSNSRFNFALVIFHKFLFQLSFSLIFFVSISFSWIHGLRRTDACLPRIAEECNRSTAWFWMVEWWMSVDLVNFLS